MQAVAQHCLEESRTEQHRAEASDADARKVQFAGNASEVFVPAAGLEQWAAELDDCSLLLCLCSYVCYSLSYASFLVPPDKRCSLAPSCWHLFVLMDTQVPVLS